MPTVTTHIDADGAVTVTIETDPESDDLAHLALTALTDEASTTALAVWWSVHSNERAAQPD